MSDAAAAVIEVAHALIRQRRWYLELPRTGRCQRT